MGVRPGYGLLDGAACEFALGLLITFIVLVCNELQNRSAPGSSASSRELLQSWAGGAAWTLAMPVVLQ